MIVVFHEVLTGTQHGADLYTDECKIYTKGGFIEIKSEDGTVMGLYNPTRFIAAKRISKEQLLAAQGVPDPSANKDAEGISMAPPKDTSNDNSAEPLHPGNGTEGQQNSPGG